MARRSYTSSNDDERGGYSTFFVSKAQRDERCLEKDALTRRLFDALRIPEPRAFKAILMPSLYGPEVGWLAARGVPRRNLFAIERSAATHAELVQRKFASSPRPMLVQDALDHVGFDHVDLVYLDFFGQPNADHIRALYKLFRLHMRPGSRLFITFGVNRGKTFACRINRRLVKVKVAGEAYVRSAHALVRDAPPIKKLVNHRYKSSTGYHPAVFTLTEVHL